MAKIQPMKGKKGTVGAPQKPINWPRTSFTMSTLFGRNEGVCHLTIRTRVASFLKSRFLSRGKARPQPNGGVGRPAEVFELTARGLAAITRKAQTKAGKGGSKKNETVAVASVVPANPPVETVTHEVETAVAASPNPAPVTSNDTIIPPLSAPTPETASVQVPA